LTGETQLRARRTRIKILKAIADRNGMAGFSEIKTSTGLSTGSIYYHLERMGNYVTKDSKHYIITEEGLQLLREVDPKYASINPMPKNEEEQSQQSSTKDSGTTTEETIRQSRHWSVRQYAFIGLICFVAIFSVLGLFTNWQALYFFAGVNSSLVASAVVASALSMSVFMLKRSRAFIGYRATMLSVFVLAVLLASILLVSGLEYTTAMTSQPDNTMDALLSSYSLHWQIR
jgi:predicted transcriptional regulator